jgi:hypothetical protein
LNRLAGSGLASEGFIVGVDPHEAGRYGGTAYWGCLVPAGGSPPASEPDGFCGRLAAGKTYH